MPQAQVTIGADPEFGFLSRGQLLHASKVITGHGNFDNSFGLDGCARIAELRPKYSTCPVQLCKNIKRTLQVGMRHFTSNNIANYHWKAGSIVGGEPLGGHIHLGHSMFKSDIANVASVLDRTLGIIGILLEDREEAIERREIANHRMATHYGLFGTERAQPWGVEWRVLSSWLTDPLVSRGVLSTAVSIAQEVVEHPELVEYIRGSIHLPDDREIKMANGPSLMFNLDKIVKFIRSTTNYVKYRRYIEFIFLLMKNRKSWGHMNDMKKSWKLEYKPCAD